MDRRFLLVAACVAALLLAAGLLGADRPIAEWVRASGIAQARVFDWGLLALDSVTGLRTFALAWVAIVAGTLALRQQRHLRVGYALLAAGIVQLAALHTMMLAKDYFGRLRPYEVLQAGDWSRMWNAGGGSFPSGHSALYFGLLLPLAAACAKRWQRALLIAIPLFVVLARIDLEKHFLSDVSASALMVALYALFAAWLTERWLPPPSRAASIRPL